jgi:hypothetical protein
MIHILLAVACWIQAISSKILFKYTEWHLQSPCQFFFHAILTQVKRSANDKVRQSDKKSAIIKKNN